jgi:glycosyltransferase involved in cell wall biosynthesis
MLLWYWGRRGGGAQYALGLARALAPAVALSISKQNELIEFLRTEDTPRHEVNTYKNIGGFLGGFARLPFLGRDLMRFARLHGQNTVISAMSHPWTPFLAPSLARAGFSFVPIVHDATPHPGDPSPLFSWRLSRELSVASAAVTLSDSVATVLERNWPKLPLIRLNLPAHLPFGIADVPKTSEFLFFGRFRAYKGLDILRDAWPLVHAAWPEATLRIVGSGRPESVAPGISLLPGVLLETRWVPDSEMAPLIASSRSLVLPYREASQSGVLPLALAHGVPIIATSVGGLAAQLADEKSGFVVRPDPTALAAAMLRLRDPICYARIAQGAQAAGELLSDWSGHAEALREGISKVVAR